MVGNAVTGDGFQALICHVSACVHSSAEILKDFLRALYIYIYILFFALNYLVLDVENHLSNV